jgi:hypothetical protein
MPKSNLLFFRLSGVSTGLLSALVLASIARANQDLDQATIDKALECWRAASCDTGSGGDLVFGYADGGGDTVNVWRGVSHMEAILQALEVVPRGNDSAGKPERR